ncbi:MAG TPA: transposase, partial [Methanocorpusculum sp.]|nr:transposase [Methanocorpusculum sp.]
MPIPDAIKKHRPTQFGAVEIRFIGGFYYVYKVSSKWDPEKGRPQKTTGKSVGKITEHDGFIPNANGMRLMQEMDMMPKTNPIIMNYGTYEMLQQLSPDIGEMLRLHFPQKFREISTFAILRLVDGVSNRMMQSAFESSYLSVVCKDIATSENSVRNFITKLGEREAEMDAYMKSFIMPKSSLLFDGTTIFCNGTDSLSARGYNPDHSLNPQVRLLYVFEKGTNRPVFYRVLQGSVVDKAAFIDIVRELGIEECIIIADKGFYSKKNLAALMEAGVKFILPLQDNTTNVEPEFYENNDDGKFDSVFVYKGRTIWARKKASGNKGNWIYTFRDDSRQVAMRTSFVARAEKDWGEEGYGPMDVIAQKRLGYFSFCSNVDTNPKEIYLTYKERWDIEQCFDYLKNNVSKSASHARTDAYFKGWAFLNHISLLYYYGLVNKLRETKLDEKYTADDVLKLTKNIYMYHANGSDEWIVSSIQKKT